MPNTINLQGGPLVRFEAPADGAVTPGDLLEIDANATDVSVFSTAGGNAQPLFALENDLEGEDIDTDYADGDTVQVGHFGSGAVVYAWLDNSSGNANKGDPLEAHDDGSLVVHTPQAVDEGGTATYTVNLDAVVGYADEDVSSPASGQVRIRVRIR